MENAQIDDSATPEFSCIQDWAGGGIGDITDSPDLVDPFSGNFHLSLSSPCIDAGTLISSVTEDFEGDFRGFDG